MPYKDADVSRLKAKERQARYRAKLRSAGVTITRTESQKAACREAVRRYRERLRSQGRTEIDRRTKEENAARIAAARAVAKATGAKLLSDTWHLRNPDAHRKRTARWRAENSELASEIVRRSQAKGAVLLGARSTIAYGPFFIVVCVARPKGAASTPRRWDSYGPSCDRIWKRSSSPE